MNCLLDKAPFGTFCDQKGKLFYENQDFSTFEARSKPKFNFLKFSKLRLSATVMNLEIVSFSTVPRFLESLLTFLPVWKTFLSFTYHILHEQSTTSCSIL